MLVSGKSSDIACGVPIKYPKNQFVSAKLFENAIELSIAYFFKIVITFCVLHWPFIRPA